MSTALATSPLVAARVETERLNTGWDAPPRHLAQESQLAEGALACGGCFVFDERVALGHGLVERPDEAGPSDE